MSRFALAAVYILGLAIAEGLRLPERIRRARSGEVRRAPEGRPSLAERLVLAALIAGVWILPFVYVFTDALRAFDYALPAWTIWPAIVVFGAGLVLRAAAQTALGRAWSHTVEIAAALIWLVRVPAEEAMMRHRFGDEYERYARRAGRVLPSRPR